MAITYRSPTHGEGQRLFAKLDELITEHNAKDGFKTSTGAIRRDVKANEFMLMCVGEGDGCLDAQFKHSDTRNYVYARQIDGHWRLDVPVTPKAFNRGEFDKFA